MNNDANQKVQVRSGNVVYGNALDRSDRLRVPWGNRKTRAKACHQMKKKTLVTSVFSFTLRQSLAPGRDGTAYHSIDPEIGRYTLSPLMGSSGLAPSPSPLLTNARQIGGAFLLRPVADWQPGADLHLSHARLWL